MTRLIFLKNHRTPGGDLYRAGLCYQVGNLELRESLVNGRIAYPEDEEPPFDAATEALMIARETRDNAAAWQHAQLRLAKRDRLARERAEQEARLQDKLERRAAARANRNAGNR